MNVRARRSRAFVCVGGELLINAQVRPGGWLRVAVAHADGMEVEGFTTGDSDAFVGDALEHRVSWGGGSAFEALRGEMVRLVFRLCGADLYSFAQRGL